jgi:hypothetical protein
VAEGTISSPLFERNAEETAARLAHVDSPAAAALQREALELVVVFRSWANKRPEPDERVATIHRLFDLNRRAMDFLIKVGPPSSGARPKPSDDEAEDAESLPRPISVRSIGR